MFEGLMQPMHLLLILFIVLVVFGPGKLPEIGSSLGKAIREFKKAVAEDEKPSLQNTASADEEKKAGPRK